ncbi:MAG: hypothetical protein ABI441_18465, partial [Flavobacterium sp.]
MNLRLFFLLIFLSFKTVSFSKTLNKETTPPIISDNSVKIFWLDENGTFHINETYIKTLTEQQRAALGYITTFVGNDCDWDGDKKTDES